MQNSKDLKIKEIIVKEAHSCFCEDWEMAVLKSGTATVVNGTAVYNLKSGDVAFFAPDTVHNFIPKENSEYFLLSFNADGEILELLKNKVVSANEDEIRLLSNSVSLIEENHNTLDSAKAFAMMNLFLLLCCEKQNLNTAVQKNAETFMLAAEILAQNIKLNLSVNELAERLYVSLSNLKRIFVNLTAIGVHEYYTFLKIAKAKEFLSQGKTVTETAELTGFSNQAYFSAAFKRVTGSSPKNYLVQKENKTRTVSLTKAAKSRADLPSYLL
jgi:AraC-like DNA-binding protein